MIYEDPPKPPPPPPANTAIELVPNRVRADGMSAKELALDVIKQLPDQATMRALTGESWRRSKLSASGMEREARRILNCLELKS
jgi:hypothetical protein